MPISNFQAEVLKVIADARNPDSFVAGGLALNRSAARFSNDIDIFHDREESVARAARRDADLLAAAGYEVRWLRREPALHTAEIAKGANSTRLEWVVDSDFRYFPVIEDPEFGYVLHPVDLAVNKLMAAASRREPRDVVDLVEIHTTGLPLGAVAWAAVTIAPGFTPEGLLAELARNARYTTEEFRALKSDPPVDPARLMSTWRTALEEAQAFVAAMPTEAAGTVYLDAKGNPVQPDLFHLDRYHAHRPVRRGHWPTAPDIASAMLTKLKRPQP